MASAFCEHADSIDCRVSAAESAPKFSRATALSSKSERFLSFCKKIPFASSVFKKDCTISVSAAGESPNDSSIFIQPCVKVVRFPSGENAHMRIHFEPASNAFSSAATSIIALKEQVSDMSEISSVLLESRSFTLRGDGAFLAPISNISTDTLATADADMLSPDFASVIANSMSSCDFNEISREVCAFFGESARIIILFVIELLCVAMMGYKYHTTVIAANLLWEELIGEKFWEFLSRYFLLPFLAASSSTSKSRSSRQTVLYEGQCGSSRLRLRHQFLKAA